MMLLPTLALLATILLLPDLARAAQDMSAPSLQLTLSGGAPEPSKVSVLLDVLFLLTILSVAPSIVLTITSFTRIIIVFSFLRQAMGVQQLPPTQVLASLAIFLTVVIMFPVGKRINDEALQPYLHEQIDYRVALDRAQEPIRKFMFQHTRENRVKQYNHKNIFFYLIRSNVDINHI